ncbi:MAG TPA: hypothetical protein VHP11_02340 [Tepidisphaeraceae bacterium]|nr:hypothetical protein [Tepidisphaeraceae bacterium]
MHLHRWSDLLRAGGVLAMLSVMLLAVGCSSEPSLFDTQEPEDKPELTYSGLAGQSCAVVVWADSRTRSDFNQVQVDLAKAVVSQLAPESKAKEQKADPQAVHFIDPRSVVRFQREHPEYEGMPITDLAPKLGASRVVYVEIEQLQIQSPRSSLLLSGYGNVTLRVIEVSDRQGRVAFEEAGISTRYPHTAPEGVIPTDKVNEVTIYQGTLNSLAKKIAARLKVK